MTSVSRTGIFVSVGFLASALLGRASAADVDFFALVVAAPTSNEAETQRSLIAQFIQGLPRRNVYLRAEPTMVRGQEHTVQLQWGRDRAVAELARRAPARAENHRFNGAAT